MLPIEKQIRSKKQLKETLTIELAKYPHKFKALSYLFGISENAILARHAILLRKTEYYTNINKRIRAFIYKILLKHFYAA